MTDFRAVRRSIKTSLDTANLSGLHVHEHWPAALQPPPTGCVCVIQIAAVDYGLTFGADRSQVAVELHLFVSLAGGVGNAEDVLAPYISNTGASSLLQALRSDPYLSSTVAYALPPTGVRDLTVRQIGPGDNGASYLGATIPLLIHVTG